GGVTLKLPGRVGDSPIVGAGLYADARTAFSATGVGEYIISVGLSLRAAITYEAKGDIVAAVEEPLSLLTRLFGPGTAGLIGVSARGEAWASFNTKAMPWAALDSAGKRALMQDLKEA
ncbi:MAG: isoaspartyl peptidase/L-asparaginase, partial [Acidilobus sp.]